MPRSAPVQQRGVALILVLTTIAILTSIGVDFSYSSRVSLKLAENLRDETRAQYMAQSAVNLSRLLLHFQRQIDQTSGQVATALGGLQGPVRPQAGTQAPVNPLAKTPGAAATAAATAAKPSLGIRLWEVLPIDSNAFTALLGGDMTAPPAESSGVPIPLERPGAARHEFGAFDGSFRAKVVDENSRINVLGLDGLGGSPLSTFIQLRAMMSDPKYDFIFDEEDANRDRVARDDVVLAMKDWVDLDETGSGIDPTNT
ncbi:MAG: hypothetical protein ACM3PC_08835, partial [Deltaproteobacteria bacterium]